MAADSIRMSHVYMHVRCCLPQHHVSDVSGYVRSGSRRHACDTGDGTGDLAHVALADRHGPHKLALVRRRHVDRYQASTNTLQQMVYDI